MKIKNLLILLILFSTNVFSYEVMVIKKICDNKGGLFSVEVKTVDMEDDYLFVFKPDEVTENEYLQSNYGLYQYPTKKRMIICTIGDRQYSIKSSGYNQNLFIDDYPILEGFKLSSSVTFLGSLINSIDIEENSLKICFYPDDTTENNKNMNIKCKIYGIPEKLDGFSIKLKSLIN
jgi:hypothetical protein